MKGTNRVEQAFRQNCRTISRSWHILLIINGVHAVRSTPRKKHLGLMIGGFTLTTYHFTGIKGSGMSALAQILDDLNEDVQGSDIEETIFTQKPLEKKHIPLLPFAAGNIKEGQHVIMSAAYGETHEEIKRARELGLKVDVYPQFLGEFISRFTSVAITGSHGKTSTTGLLSHVLGSICPTSYLIGDGTGKGTQDSSYFVFEACEYRRHFLNYSPDYCVMTNIDFDHPDYFTSVDDVVSAFQSMAKQVNKAIIACGDDEYLQKLQANVPIVFYGLVRIMIFKQRQLRVETKERHSLCLSVATCMVNFLSLVTETIT